MLAIRSRNWATMLFTLTLSSLLLAPVLASAPEANQNSIRSQAIAARDSTYWITPRQPESSLTNLGFRSAPEAVDHGLNAASGDAAEAVEERAEFGERAGDVGKSNHESTLVQREPDFGGVHWHERSSSPVMTSAAPTVFGINIYLIIAWLVLLYLMFRTGSISSTEDSKNYEEEIIR